MSSRGIILGYNSPSSVCVASNKVLVAAGSSVVINQKSESVQWVPVDDRQSIGRLAYSATSRLICVTEVRLSVSIHVFRFPDFSCLQRIPDVATVDVQDLLFSPNGHMLGVLACMPNTQVTLFSVQRGRNLQKCTVIELGGLFLEKLVFSPQRMDCVAVMGSDELFIVSHIEIPPSTALSSSASRGVLKLTSHDYVLCSCAWGTLGIICGTKKGHVILFDELKLEKSVFFTCPTSGAVSAVLCSSAMILAGTEEGSVFAYDANNGVLNLVYNASQPVCGLLLSENTRKTLVLTDTRIVSLDCESGSSTLVHFRHSGNTVQVLTLGSLVVVVCTDGTMTLYDNTTNTYTQYNVDTSEGALDACIMGDNVFVVAYDSGCVRSFVVDGKLQMSSCVKVAGTPLTQCAWDGNTFLVVSDGNTVHLLIMKEDCVTLQGYTDEFSGKVIKLRWVSKEQTLLAACTNGEVYLVTAFDKTDDESGTLIVETVWRLDFPVADFLPLYADDDVINVLVHSMDKDTKLYVLERRRERDQKSLRPLFLMRDHESGGSILQRLSASSIISMGSDGKVVVRDVAHYLLRLTPIPPSKEKRRPVGEFSVRPFSKKGKSCLSVWGESGGFVCGNTADRVIHLVTQGGPIRYAWKEPRCREEKVFIAMNVDRSPEPEDMTLAQHTKSLALAALNELRLEVGKLLEERTSAVRVEDFLLPKQQKAFREECDVAIQKAKEDDYYHLLLNSFTQHMVRRECWDTMQVPRSKIVSLNDLSIEVHNFHRRKADGRKTRILKKAKFMRSLQLKDPQYFTFSSCVQSVDDRPRTTSQNVKDLNEDITPLLFETIDVYTRSRAIIQIILLGGKISAVKTSYNAIFDTLRERKASELNRIGERNDRCRRIIRQLGDVPPTECSFFEAVFDREEDPQTVFEVFDSEIDPELLKLAKRKDSSTNIISLTNEAALKTWMDGLEKDTEVIEVKVSLPTFADESTEDYVTPDERTDEQQRAYEEYEKQLNEQTLLVNERKEALREEMIRLQKSNIAGANKIDEEILELRKRRMDAAELVDELELHQVNAFHVLLLPRTISNEIRSVSMEREELEQRIRLLESLEEYRRQCLVKAEEKQNNCAEEEKSLATGMRNSPPFDDADWGDRLYKRFSRWRVKYEAGEALVPQPDQNDAIPSSIWIQYCECCMSIVDAKKAVAVAAAEVQSLTTTVEEVEAELTCLREMAKGKEMIEESYRRDAIRRILNIQDIYCLRQGQVQDERAVVNADFASFSFRWVKDVIDYNELIFASFEELQRFMEKMSLQRHSLKMCSWETERLQYCVGTMEMELRQLHTLRVTRQMQESIHYGVGITQQEATDKLNRQIEHLRFVTSKKVEDRNRVITRLRMQIKDRMLENSSLGNQVERTKSLVDDKKAVWSMLGEHNNEEQRLHQRMRELRENSELEELARCQQEELVRLKREIDRLRERTFPSFAVVSKKTVR